LDYDEVNALHNFIFNVYEIGSITLDEYLDTVVFNHRASLQEKILRSLFNQQSVELPTLKWLKEWKKDWRFPHHFYQ